MRIRLALILIASLCVFALTPLYAQETQPIGAIPTTNIVTTPISPQPFYGALQPIVDHQQQIIEDIYCTEHASQLWIFELDESPDASDGVSGSHATVGVGNWTPRTVEKYNWTEGYLAGEISLNNLIDLLSTQSRGWVLIGDLEGSCGTKTIMALGLSRYIDGTTKNYLIPVIAIPEVVADDFDLLLDFGILTRTIPANCDQCDDGCCYERYRKDIADAILDFKSRLKSDFPISWKNLACFLGCTPTLAATPFVYAICVAACNGAVTAIGGANLVNNTQQYEMDRENAKIKYCTCRNWQASNCSGGAEPDLVGCP